MAFTFTLHGPDASRFYQFPIDLLQPTYTSLTLDAKLFYALLLDRTALSMRTLRGASKKSWETAQGVFCRFNRRSVMQLLSCAQAKATGLYRQLCEHDLLHMEDDSAGNLFLKKVSGMISETTDPYFHSKLPCSYRYWRIPKALVQDESFKDIPGGAKLLYAYLLHCSKEGTVTIKKCEAAKLIGMEQKTLSKYLAVLEATSLIERIENPKKMPAKRKSPHPSAHGEEENQNLHRYYTAEEKSRQGASESKSSTSSSDERIWNAIFEQVGEHWHALGASCLSSPIVNEIIIFLYSVYAQMSGYYRIGKRTFDVNYLRSILRNITPAHIDCVINALIPMIEQGSIHNFGAYIKAVTLNAVQEDHPARRLSQTMHKQRPHHEKKAYQISNRPSREAYEHLIEQPCPLPVDNSVETRLQNR